MSHLSSVFQISPHFILFFFLGQVESDRGLVTLCLISEVSLDISTGKPLAKVIKKLKNRMWGILRRVASAATVFLIFYFFIFSLCR